MAVWLRLSVAILLRILARLVCEKSRRPIPGWETGNVNQSSLPILSRFTDGPRRLFLSKATLAQSPAASARVFPGKPRSFAAPERRFLGRTPAFSPLSFV